jgi:hypothetical protein
VSGCATAGLPVLLHNTTIGRNAMIRNAIGFTEHDGSAQSRLDLPAAFVPRIAG